MHLEHRGQNSSQNNVKIPDTLWRRKWQPTPVLLPGQFHGWGSLAGHRPWGGRVGHH